MELLRAQIGRLAVHKLLVLMGVRPPGSDNPSASSFAAPWPTRPPNLEGDRSRYIASGPRCLRPVQPSTQGSLLGVPALPSTACTTDTRRISRVHLLSFPPQGEP